MLVAVESAQDGVTLFHREGNTVRMEARDYNPWLLIREGHYLWSSSRPATQLDGPGEYSRLVEYDRWQGFWTAWNNSRETGNAIIYPSATKQYLMRSGERLFGGIGWGDSVRLTFDLETTGLDPQNERILLIACKDSRGEETVLCGDEEQMLRDFRVLVRRADPDILIGHNVYGFDLPFLLARMAVYCLSPNLGRGLPGERTVARVGKPRPLKVGANDCWYTPVYIPGRHVLDTYLQVQRYDAPLGKLDSFALKSVARAYDIAEPHRIELPRERMLDIYRANSGLVTEYAMQDVRETHRLANIVAPSEFMQCGVVPDGFGGIITTGNGEKWDSILVSEYLARGLAIPERQEPQPYEGGLVECRKQGVLAPVVKADVESLYPSIMLTKGIRPASDTADVMLPLLGRLKGGRLDAKRLAKGCATERERDYWDGIQNSAKVLINSAYGFMGGPFRFGDWRAAEAVTREGRRIVTAVAEFLSAAGSTIIEVDTDGVLFVPPGDVTTEEQERALISRVSAELDEGINLAHDGRYAAMLSLRMKTYVLQDYDGGLHYKGAALKSRSAPLFLMNWLHGAVEAALAGNLTTVADTYRALLVDLHNRRVDIDGLKRRERVTPKTFESSARKRLAVAAEGLTVGSYLHVYEREDGTLGLAEDYAGDEDRLYYMQALHGVASRLADLFGDDFATLFPKPGKRNMLALGGG